MDIIKNKRKSYCGSCNKLITSKYKVKDGRDTFHMNCFKPWVEKAIIRAELRLEKLKSFVKLFKRHHKEMILEALEKNTTPSSNNYRKKNGKNRSCQ